MVYEYVFFIMVVTTIIIALVYNFAYKSPEKKVKIVVSHPDNGDCSLASALENFDISIEEEDLTNVRLKKLQ